MRKLLASGVCVLLAITGCGRKKRKAVPIPAIVGSVETGIASWYGNPYHGRAAASGEIYDMEALTAAHRTLPFGTWVRVLNLTSDKQVEVRINDRGPFVEGRIIDLSHAAARAIAMIGPGIVPVRLEVIAPPAVAAVEPAHVPAPAAPPADSAPTTPVAPGPAPAPAPAPPVAVPAASADNSATAPAPSEPTIEQPDVFAVQVGAFQNRANAERIRGEMEKLYGSAQLVERAGAPVVWRVLAGRERTIAAANALAERIRSAGLHRTAFVVRVDAPAAPASRP